MTTERQFLTGVIEGFYGRPWSWQDRLLYADYLSSLGLNSYIYCPKSDACLRKNWAEFWPLAEQEEMRRLIQVYTAKGLNCGVGLSPYALYESYGDRERNTLQAKVRYLQSMQVKLVAILFDDMPGAIVDLAHRQAEIVKDVCTWAPDARIVVCPTYYSFDPALEKYFGTMPSHYWQQLGAQLPSGVDIFWTGNRVCSEVISADDIARINDQLGRRVVLWDNYPVNDGSVRSQFLYTSVLSGREGCSQENLMGHFCNPMNQSQLSLFALQGLSRIYDDGDNTSSDWLKQLYGQSTFDQIMQNSQEFESVGLAGMATDRKRALAETYARLPGRVAQEVAGWLRGEYTFDPACLTD